MNRLTAAAHRYVERIGPLGVVGLGLLVFAASLCAGLVVPAYEELQEARANYERMSQRMSVMSGERQARTGDVRKALAEFIAHFPPADDARQDILRLQAFAANHGVQLVSGEYRFAPERGIEIVRHQVTFPVTGSYLEIRAFIAEALQELPSCALESVSFKRDSASARRIEARLQFALYTAAS